jgi:hypothetical protein
MPQHAVRGAGSRARPRLEPPLCRRLAQRRAVNRHIYYAFTRRAWPPRALHSRPGAVLTGRTVQLPMFILCAGRGDSFFVAWASPTDASLRGQRRWAMPTLRWLTQCRAEYSDHARDARPRIVSGPRARMPWPIAPTDEFAGAGILWPIAATDEFMGVCGCLNSLGVCGCLNSSSGRSGLQAFD